MYLEICSPNKQHTSASSHINDNLSQFNIAFVQPALRELINKIDDFVEDEVEGKDEIDYGNIQVFNIGTISNKNGNVALGSNININQNIKIENLTDEFAKAILDEGFTLSQLDNVRNEVEELKKLIIENDINESKIKNIFSKIVSVGGKVMAEILLQLISKPEITTMVLKSVF
jgi:hypothetical protein